MANSVGARAWSTASRPWESPESTANECPLAGWLLGLGGTICRQHEYGWRFVTEDTIGITAAGSTPIAWQAGQAQLPFRRHPDNTFDPAATALGTGDDAEAELTQKVTWADRSSIGQSTPWDAGRDARTEGQLVDAYG